MRSPTQSDRKKLAGKVDVDAANAVARCQYCSPRCGGSNKCGATPKKND